jgi:hypothetical protein
MEWQSAQAIASAQGAWMRIVGGKRLDNFIERARAAGDTCAESLAQLDQRLDNVVGM